MIDPLFKDKIIELFKFLIYPFTLFMFDYLQIDRNLIEVLCILMLIDSILGGIKSVRLGGVWSFKTMLWGMILKISLLFIPVTLALMAKAANYQFDIFVKAVIGIMIVSEGYSIIGNYYSAKNKIKLQKIDVISLMLKSIRQRLKKTALQAISDIEGANDCEIKKYENDK